MAIQTTQLHIRLSPADLKRARLKARKLGLTVSLWIRKIIQKGA